VAGLILVIGAGGATGSATLSALREHAGDRRVRATTHSPERTEALRALGAEPVVADLDDPASLARALTGVERVFLATPPVPQLPERERNVVAAAEQGGVYHLVKVGALGQQLESPARLLANHADATQALQESSLRWTLLTPNGFMTNSLGWAPMLAGGTVATALGAEHRVAHVDPRDVGEVAARGLTEDGHESATYTLTGPEALSDAAMVATIARVTGREARHVQASDDDLRGALTGAGIPGWTIDALLELWEAQRAGLYATVTPDAEALLGRPPRTYEEFVRDHRAAFTG
jgi:uncharacterized protein YbjT (DUF2867 family)